MGAYGGAVTPKDERRIRVLAADVKTHSHDGRSFLDSTVLELLNEIDALRAQVAELRARLVADIIVADIIASGFPQA